MKNLFKLLELSNTKTRLIILFSSILGSCVSLLEIYMIKLLSGVIDSLRLSLSEGQNLSLKPIILLSVLVIITCIGRIYVVFFVNKNSEAISHSFLVDIFSKIKTYNYLNFIEHKPRIVTLLSTKAEYTGTKIFKPLMNFIIYANLLIILIIALILYSNIYILIMVTLVGAFYATSMFFIRPLMVNLGSEVNRTSTKITNLVIETADAYLELKINRAQKLATQRYADAGLTLRKAMHRNATLAEIPRYIFESLGIIGLLAVFFVASLSESVIILTLIQEIFVFGVIAQRLLPVVQQLYSSYSSILSSKAHIEELILYKTWPKLEDNMKSSINIGREKCISIIGDKLSFEQDGRLIFKDISFNIRSSDIVNLYGKSGSGKSTLVSMILGLTAPTNGSLTIHLDSGKTENSINNLFDNASICAQRPLIFKLSLINNIYFDMIPTNEMQNEYYTLVDKLQLSHLEKQKYLEPDILSGGEKQRISILRALCGAKERDILVFDEPTNGLDERMQKVVRELIYAASKEKIVLLISHNIQDRKLANQRVELHS